MNTLLNPNILSLHSVRKSPTKTWNKKAPIAPMAPTPIKVYKVDPINFKELVQSLTCAPQFMPPQPHHNLDLQSTTDHTTAKNIVPSLPMKNLSSRDNVEVSSPLVPVSTTTTSWYQYFQAEYFGKNYEEKEVITPSLLEMNLFSPTSFGNWCFVPPIMNPRV
uniref:VQ domain-containing protein n=1 Tax=Medicago truncatula TaxID=3880 RepID=I3S4T6_MEDTR|nr:unknown [Medicago truncatula]